jgi:hypothetical protein
LDRRHGDRLLPWIDGLWLAGVCLLALRAVGGWLRLRSLRRNARFTVPPAIQKSFAKVIAQLRLAQPVALRLAELPPVCRPTGQNPKMHGCGLFSMSDTGQLRNAPVVRAVLSVTATGCRFSNGCTSATISFSPGRSAGM